MHTILFTNLFPVHFINISFFFHTLDTSPLSSSPIHSFFIPTLILLQFPFSIITNSSSPSLSTYHHLHYHFHSTPPFTPTPFPFLFSPNSLLFFSSISSSPHHTMSPLLTSPLFNPDSLQSQPRTLSISLNYFPHSHTHEPSHVSAQPPRTIPFIVSLSLILPSLQFIIFLTILYFYHLIYHNSTSIQLI